MKLKTLLFLFVGLFISTVNAQIVISEIMYNNAGADSLEFVEFYNTTTSDIDLTGYTVATAITHTFSGGIIAANGYLVLAKSAGAFQTVFGMNAAQWDSGTLKNSGETIQLYDANNGLVDEVAYDDSAPWSTLADSYGSSLVLCDVASDNALASSWSACNTSTNAVFEGRTVYANPLATSDCNSFPLIALSDVNQTVAENGVLVSAELIVNNNGPATSIDIVVDAASTADASDYSFESMTIAIPAMTDTILLININITDDMVEEQKEDLIFDLVDGDGQVVFLNDRFSLEIVDNDGALASALILTGVFDVQTPTSAGAKGIEVFAREDILDLSDYGVGFANNGGGSDEEEFTFPSMSVTAGTFFYINTDSTKFRDYFGFDSDFISGNAGINGNDAIEVFENGIVIDVYGDINVDGEGTAWDYVDGWAYRKVSTGPDGNTFVIGNWNISGPNALTGEDTNSAVANPFPIGSYSLDAPEAYEAKDDSGNLDMNGLITIDVLANDVRVDLLSSLIIISQQPTMGTVEINADSTITYTPTQGMCGNDSFQYEGCEVGSCSQGTVSISINCPSVYNVMTIGAVTQNDANGISTYIDSLVELTGVVYGSNLSTDGLSFTIIDAAGDGINVYSNTNDSNYTVTEGDELVIKGQMTEYNGLTEIYVDELDVMGSGMTLEQPTIITTFGEDAESQLVMLENVTFVDPAQWGGTGSGFNVDVTDGTNTFAVRIDNDLDLFNMSIPTGTLFNVIGIGGQYDSSTPYEDGYQLFPRYVADFIPVTNVETPEFASEIAFGPNPVKDFVMVTSKVQLSSISVFGLNGQLISKIDNPGLTQRVNLSNVITGTYLIQFEYNNEVWTKKLIKK